MIPRAQRRAQVLWSGEDVVNTPDLSAGRVGETANPELLDRCARDVIVAVESSLTSSQGNELRCFSILSTLFELLRDDSPGIQTLFGPDFGTAETRERVEELELWICAMIAERICQEGDVTMDEATLMASALVGLATSAARFWVRNSERLDGAHIELMSRIVWRGIHSLPRDATRTS